MEVYTKKHLLDALKKAHDESVAKGGPALPYTYKSLLVLEKQGIIRRGGEIKSANNDRFFTREEIEDIVSKVKAKKTK